MSSRSEISTIDQILLKCSGLKPVATQHEASTWSVAYTSYEFIKVGDIELPEDPIYIEITSTATKGTIARVVDLELETYEERYPDTNSKSPNKVVSYCTTLIYEVDGRKQKGRIDNGYTKLLVGPQETKYVRNVKKHKKVVVKNPVNKFKQELQRGDWVIGVRKGSRTLGVGRITRWTNHSVWGVTGDDLDDKKKEFQFHDIAETITIPPDEASQLLTMAVLKGWNGR